MKLYNTRTRQIDDIKPIDKTVRIYSCGPTVYDYVHIGNLSAFTYADLLRRAIRASGWSVRHVMNFTDVDDKTIARSKEVYPDLEPMEALTTLTDIYQKAFLDDMAHLGNNPDELEFVSATKSIEGMRQLIGELYREGFAYITEDGIYFSIEKYRTSGKKYGQLSEITEARTSSARIQNDEYDKDNVHDFALWKKQKAGEPAWEFELEGRDLTGRPGWHIECSVMSVQKLGQPFDIHTGGIDLIFPHHENEIAQSTAVNGDEYASIFFHNEHLLVDGKKMSKSLNNFYTLKDIKEKGYDPLAFRLLVIQSHYRNQSNFTWENLKAAQNRLIRLNAIADLRWNVIDTVKAHGSLGSETYQLDGDVTNYLLNDLNTPLALAALQGKLEVIEGIALDKGGLPLSDVTLFSRLMEDIDAILGLNLAKRPDITDEQKKLIAERQKARQAKDWATSDKIRDLLHKAGITVKDTDQGPVWSRI